MYQATQVRKQVSEIKSDLSESFLERRLLEHKHSPEEELHDVVAHLILRESQLSSLAESTAQLLNHYDELESELDQKNRENAAAIRAQQTAEHELSLCTDALSIAEERASRLSKLLDETEQSRDTLSSELHTANKSLQQVEKWGEPSRDSFEISMEEAKSLLEIRCQNLDYTVQSLTREKDQLVAAVGRMENEMSELRDARDAAKAEITKLKEKQKRMQSKSMNVSLKLAQSEETIKFLEFDLSLARKKAEKLEEDLSVATDLQKDESLHNSMMGFHERHVSVRTYTEEDEAFSSDEEAIPSKPSRGRRDLSLTLRDDILQDEELFLGRNAGLSPRRNGGNKHFTFGAVLDVSSRLEEISIAGTTAITEKKSLHSTPVKARYSQQPVRKDPGEEFFILAVQAIKLNSPYMDEICTESPQELYMKALNMKVPFHQWYPWIEEMLKDVYLQITGVQKGAQMEILAIEPVSKSKRKTKSLAK